MQFRAANEIAEKQKMIERAINRSQQARLWDFVK